MFQRLLSSRNMPLLRSSTVKKHIFGSSRSLSIFSLHAGQPGVVLDLTPYSATKSKGNRQRRNTSKLSFVSKRSLCSSSEGILAKSPSDFVQLLQDNNINRCYVVYDKKTGKPKASHPELQELADFFAADDIDYRQHEGAFMALGMRTKALLGAFIWRTNRGQACGGIRLWQYSSMEKYLRDGLRLAFGMGVKSALAGLWAGGGKGVVAEPGENKHLDPTYRRDLLFDYGDFLSSLNGCYIAAEDLGLTVSDIDNVHARTRYTTCISEDLGGSGNPSIPTGKGVICAMEAALDYFHMGTLENKTVAIQGAGNVAVVIIEGLLKRNVSHIYVTDCNQKRVDDVKDMFARKSRGRLVVEKVPLDSNEVLAYPCDILSPCALGNVLTKRTIERMQTKFVCGAANNQLGDHRDSQLMAEKGITYIPDFLANRMGIVNCANENYGRLPNDPAITRHFSREWQQSIFVEVKEILDKAANDDITTEDAAMAIADKMSKVDHPVWPGRSQQIIDNLVEGGWHEGNDFWR